MIIFPWEFLTKNCWWCYYSSNDESYIFTFLSRERLLMAGIQISMSGGEAQARVQTQAGDQHTCPTCLTELHVSTAGLLLVILCLVTSDGVCWWRTVRANLLWFDFVFPVILVNFLIMFCYQLWSQRVRKKYTQRLDFKLKPPSLSVSSSSIHPSVLQLECLNTTFNLCQSVPQWIKWKLIRTNVCSGSHRYRKIDWLISIFQ